ncbi:hypothetical protein PQQ87_08430 [Paraburkholderia nemoris]|uniref:hypothetical protein n=1 Tax=Paraburkholderia nemoris TaxID=2793076 RepID=UPI0038B714A3
MVAFLDKWQTLIGAAIGGGMGAAGALIVAWNATRRERRIAATMVLPEVMSFQAADAAIKKILKVSHLSKSAQMKHVSLLLLKQRPKIRALHSQVATQLYDLDGRLYAHLAHCQMIHEEFEAALDLFGQEVNAAKAPLTSVEDAASIEAGLDVGASAVTTAWDYCVEHAALANYYLDRFVFRRWPVWGFKLKMRIFPNDLDRRSAHLLETAKLLDEKSTIPSSSIDENTPL